MTNKVHVFLNITEDFDFRFINKNIDNSDFDLFKSFLEDNDDDEFVIPDNIKSKLDFVRSISTMMNGNYKELITILSDKRVFMLFQYLKWDMSNLFRVLYQGYTIFKKVVEIFTDFTYNAQITSWNETTRKKASDFVKYHYYLKRIKGSSVASMLTYLWFNNVLTNDITMLSISDVLDSYSEDISLSDIFDRNYKIIELFVQGFPISVKFPWPGKNTVHYLMLMFGLIVRKLKIRTAPVVLKNFYLVNKSLKY